MRRVRRAQEATAITVLTLAATALGPAASASGLASANTVTIKVVGISRTGKTVSVASSVAPLHGNSIPGIGPTYRLKPGTYFISGDVPTPTSNQNVVDQTLVVRKVDVRKSGTIKLDSRGGQLVSVWLNGKELSPDVGGVLAASACVANGSGRIYADLSGPIYVKPTQVKGLSFVWAWSSGPDTGTHYDLTGATKDSLPAHPVFRLRTSQLVKTVIQVKAGTVAGTGGYLSTQSTVSPYCWMGGLQQPVSEPSSITVYRSPAVWTTELDTIFGPRQCGFDIVGTKEIQGHRPYTVPVGAAARGPYAAVPTVLSNKLAYDTQNQFVGPADQSVDYCFKSTVTLASGGHTIAKGPGGQFHVFTAKVHPGRWYVLTTRSWQMPAGRNPTELLSTRTTLAWRFKFAKNASGAVPVAVTSLVPQGLNLSNRAAPGSMTTVRAFFTQGKYAIPPPAVPVRSFTVQASFNDGKTWHQVAVVKHRGFWTFVVHNPSSGFVTLRTTTVNTQGNSSVETIYQAYGIR
jgi:hypothetical protein